MMQLFRGNNFEKGNRNVSGTAVHTPLGMIALQALRNGEDLFPNACRNVFVSNVGNSMLYQWSHADCVVEVLKHERWFEMESEIASRCVRMIFFVVGFKATVDTGTLSYDLGWCNDFKWNEHDFGSGEMVEYSTWRNKEWCVTIGTDDYESLAYRAIAGDGIPKRFRSLFDTDRAGVWQAASDDCRMMDVNKRGLHYDIKSMRAGESIYLNYEIAITARIGDVDEMSEIVIGHHLTSILALAECEKAG